MRLIVGKNRYRTLILSTLFSMLAMIVFLLILEAGVRVYFLVRNQVLPQARHLSEEFGWVTLENIESVRAFDGFGKITYTTTRDGFRVFGDLNASGKKIFVIGDSQTQARKVPDGHTFFDYLAAHTNAEVFAYGGGGYGSLQEFMILDKFVDLIDPNIVLWQFCNNDLYNNSFELESTTVHNNHMTRPYLEGDEIVYRYPSSSWFFRNVLRHSYLVRLTRLRLAVIAEKYCPPEKIKLSLSNPAFIAAFVVTDRIMGMVKSKLGNVPIVAFSACGNSKSPVNARFAGISRAHGIFYIDGVPDAVLAKKASGVKVDGTPYDKHWTGAGHAIAGAIIVDYLSAHGFVDKAEP